MSVRKYGCFSTCQHLNTRVNRKHTNAVDSDSFQACLFKLYIYTINIKI